MNMKHASYTIIVCAIIHLSAYSQIKQETDTSKHFTIKIEPKWKDLDQNKKTKIFNDKWVLACDIIIKKLAPDFISLQEIHLSWKGKQIEHLLGSLYEKNSDRNFMPIQKYLICDSTWKKSEQKLILKFDKPKKLYATNKLSLVLTIPAHMEKTLKSGCFTVESDILPEPYSQFANQNNLCLCFSESQKTFEH